MEHLPPTLVPSHDDAAKYRGAAVLHLFIRACFQCDGPLWSYVLWGVLQEADDHVLYVPRADSRASEAVFCLRRDTDLEIIRTQRDAS